MPDPGTQAGRRVLQAAIRTSGANHALVTGDHPAVRRVVEDTGARVVDEAWLRAVGGAPLPLVDAVEDRLGPVGDGVQLGERGRPNGQSEPPDPGAVTSITLSHDLVAAARDVDRDAARAAVASHAVAFAVEDAGVGCEVAVADGLGESHDQRSVVDRIHTGLIDVLQAGYDRVERTEDAVVVAREAFDPAAAAERGVPEGPAFGRLAAGESVTVDGRTVEPEAVHRVERRRLPLDPPETGEPKQK
jgi:D-aminoacyl-tRNA deacylase